MKKLLLVMVVILAVFCLTACGKVEEAPVRTETESTNNSTSSPIAMSAAFSSFIMYSGFVQDNFTVELENAKINFMLNGLSTANSVISNFIARGGDRENILEGGIEPLSLEEALVTVTKVSENGKFASENNTTLSVRDSKGKELTASYYATPQGKVFCWPPYANDGKNWVCQNVTVKDATGNEVSKVDLNSNNEYFISFSTLDAEETIKITTNKDGNVTMEVQ